MSMSQLLDRAGLSLSERLNNHINNSVDLDMVYATYNWEHENGEYKDSTLRFDKYGNINFLVWAGFGDALSLICNTFLSYMSFCTDGGYQVIVVRRYCFPN